MFPLISECGKSNLKNNVTAANAAANTQDNQNSGVTCTLTYISDRFILTAAHCLSKL